MRAHITPVDHEIHRKYLRAICDELRDAVLDVQRHRRELHAIAERIDTLLNDAESIRTGGLWPRRPRLHV